MDCNCEVSKWFADCIDFPDGYKRDGMRRAYLEAKERGDPEEILFTRLRLDIENLFANKCYDSFDYAHAIQYTVEDYVKRISSPTGQ